MARAREESLVGRTRTHGRRGATGPEGVVCHERVDEVCKSDVVCVGFMSSAHHFFTDEEFWGCAVSVWHGDQIGARNLCQSRMRAQTSPSTYLSLTTSIFHAIFRQFHTTGRGPQHCHPTCGCVEGVLCETESQSPQLRLISRNRPFPFQREIPGNMLSKRVRTLVTGSIATPSPSLPFSNRRAARGMPVV
jgi:hypothetical protein